MHCSSVPPGLGSTRCDGINTLYTERYTRSAFLYRYSYEPGCRNRSAQQKVLVNPASAKTYNPATRVQSSNTSATTFGHRRSNTDLETLWRVTTYVPEEGDNLVYRALERVKTHLVSALHYVYDFVRAGGCVTV